MTDLVIHLPWWSGRSMHVGGFGWYHTFLVACSRGDGRLQGGIFHEWDDWSLGTRVTA